MFRMFLFLLFLAALADARGFAEAPDKVTQHPRTKRANVCYGDLGCFDNGPPFQSVYRPISFQPEAPDEISTDFVLFARQETAGVHIPAANLSNIESTDFMASRPTKFIVHGWQETTLRERYFVMKDALLTAGDCNVILVDWQNGAKKLYGQATANTRVVGAQIAQLIKHLEDTQGAKPEDMHIIGHSLGSHVSGYAGALTPGLGRISALDPAEPYFQYTDPVVRLDPTDAVFVDVIHTDAASFYSTDMGFGMSQPAGHVDFYPNGGHNQPGCTGGVVSVLEGIIADETNCNHGRSVQLFTDTIKAGHCPYRAYQCENADDFGHGKCIPCAGTGCGIVGMHAEDVRPADGASNVKYFFNTGEDAPYCRFHYKVTLTFPSGEGEEQRGKLLVKLAGSDASTDMIQVTEDPVYIYTGRSYTYVVTSPDELGDVGKVTFRWVQEATLWDWSTWYVWSTPAVYLDGVQVYSGEAQKGTCSGPCFQHGSQRVLEVKALNM